MKKIKIEFVYKKLSLEQKKSIINMWLNAGVLSQDEAIKRVEQVSVIINDNEKIVGVSTVYPALLSPNNPYFFFRMFILREYRGSNLLRTEVMQINFAHLKKDFQSSQKGIVIELENQKLANLADKTNYMKKRGYTYYGKSDRGLQLWYVDFETPKYNTPRKTNSFLESFIPFE